MHSFGPVVLMVGGDVLDGLAMILSQTSCYLSIQCAEE